MVGIAHLWRRLAGALAALLVSAMVLAPSLDQAVCGPDEAVAIASHTAEEPPHAHPDADHPILDADHAHRDPGGCVHGHCHNASCNMPATDLAFHAEVWTPARLTPPETAKLATKAYFELMRPPRA